MKEQNNEQLHNRQHDPNRKENTQSPQKGMNREAEDELLTTGGPVDRSAVEDNADRGVINAHTGGMSMKDEEANPSKDDFAQGQQPKGKKGRSARYGHPEQSAITADPAREDEDTSQDKTEGIINPRSTMDDWAKFKGQSLNKSSGQGNKGTEDRGKNNNDDTGEEFKDIAPL